VDDIKQDGLTGLRKTQENWVAEIDGLMPRIEVAGDICMRSSRSTQSSRADDDDDDDDDVLKADTVCATKHVLCIDTVTFSKVPAEW